MQQKYEYEKAKREEDEDLRKKNELIEEQLRKKNEEISEL
jgi:hypothetical protein